MKTPMVIIGGYLGSGKTTLLKRIIEREKRKIAVVMNEFGDIGIDTEIVKQGKNIKIAELLGGCVCCSLTGEFEEAVNEIIDTVNPELIVVETTGVAEPDALITDIQNLEKVYLDTVIVIVDGHTTIQFPKIGRAGLMQIESADIILLNKCDLISAEENEGLRKFIEKMNSRAQILKTRHCDADVDILFGLDVERHAKHAGKKRQHIRMQAISVETNENYGKEKIEKFVRGIFRIKGYLNIEGEKMLLNAVAGRCELERSESDKNRIVFIGEGVHDRKEKIIEELEKCRTIS